MLKLQWVYSEDPQKPWNISAAIIGCSKKKPRCRFCTEHITEKESAEWTIQTQTTLLNMMNGFTLLAFGCTRQFNTIKKNTENPGIYKNGSKRSPLH